MLHTRILELKSMQEPSLLDYLKSLLDPRRPRIHVPWDDPDSAKPPFAPDMGNPDEEVMFFAEDGDPTPGISPLSEGLAPAESGEPGHAGEPIPVVIPTPMEHVPPAKWPWLSLAAIVVALIAQNSFEPPVQSWKPGVALYVFSAILLVVAYLRQEWQIVPLPHVRIERDTFSLRQTLLIAAGVLTLAAFYLFNGNLFTTINLTLWVAVMSCCEGGVGVSGRGDGSSAAGSRRCRTPRKSRRRGPRSAARWRADLRLRGRLPSARPRCPM